MEKQDQMPPHVLTTSQTPEITNQHAGAELFKEGVALLRGSGVQQDFSMAAARLLDAADLHHSAAYYFCALLYFAGIGVSRNTENASQYAAQYLEADSKGPFAAAATSIIDGTLGTENAKKLLLEKKGGSQPPLKTQSQRKYLLAAAIGMPLIFVAGLLVFFMSKTQSSLALGSIAGIKLELLLPKDDVDQARKEAMSIAATLQTDAQVVMQKQKATQEAQAKAEHDQKLAQEAQIKAEQDRQKAEAEARAVAAAQPAQLSAAMIASAREAARRGEFDRANGILDGVLAGDPSSKEAQSLKISIRQARSQAVNNLQIR